MSETISPSAIKTQPTSSSLLTPLPSETSLEASYEAAIVNQDPPLFVKILSTLALVLMANQLSLAPIAEKLHLGPLGKIGLGEIGFVLAVAAIACVFHKRKYFVQLPWFAIGAVLVAAIANFLSTAGTGSLIDVIQLAEYLFGGCVLFAFMLRYMPHWTLIGATIALVLNLGIAAIQDCLYGAYIVIAPRDVIELPWGIGKAMTGLFRSKIAFSFFVAVATTWVVPQWLGYHIDNAPKRFLRNTLCVILVAWAVFAIPYAPFAILAAAVTIAASFAVARTEGSFAIYGAIIGLAIALYEPSGLHKQAWNSTLSPLKGYDYVPDATILFNRSTPYESDNPSQAAHELKTSHYDFFAAMRLSSTRPLCGIGSGKYQKAIAKAYSLDEDRRWGTLANPALNDIETDSQSGWGIIAATLGLPALAVFALLFLTTFGNNLRRILEDYEDGTFVHVASAASLLVFIIGMFFSDPLTRGLGWYAALGIAASQAMPCHRTNFTPTPFNAFSELRLLITAIVLAVAIGLVTIGPKVDILHLNESAKTVRSHKPAAETAPASTTEVKPAEAPAAEATPAEAKPAEAPKPEAAAAQPAEDTSQYRLTAEDSDELYLVFNADKAFSITAPMAKQDDREGKFAQGILVIPDHAGVPPAGKNPALEYGGCVFECEIPRDYTAYVWLNVVWNGSCGNTLDVRIDDDPVTYTVGNDGTYNAWHWQKSPKSFKLAPGRHRIQVLNREDGIQVSQMLLTNDKEYIPDGVEGE